MFTNNYLKVRQGKRSAEFYFDKYNDLSKASARQAANMLARELRISDPDTSVEIAIFRHCKDGFAFLPCVGGCAKCAKHLLRLVETPSVA